MVRLHEDGSPLPTPPMPPSPHLNHSTSTGALAAASNSPKHFLLISQQVSGGNFCVNWNFGKNLKKIRQMEVIDPQSALRS